MPISLLLITGIFPPDSGGPAKFAIDFGQWASTQNYRVQIKTYSDDSARASDSNFFELEVVPRTDNILVRYLKMIKLIGSGISGNASVLAVGAFLETYIASIVYGFDYVAKVPGDIVWERARNNGVSNLEIDDFQNERLNLKYKLFRILYTKSLKQARIVIVPSMGLYKLCTQWGVAESKLRLIYNSVDIQPKSKVEKNNKFDLITVCRLAPWKGVDELIEYAGNRNLSLVVLGDGPERSRLESLAGKNHANVSFKGEVSPQQVHSFLLQSKVFVLNSYYEGLPHALVEARAAGVLSVGRAGTGSAEVINDDVDGFLIRSNRPLEETLDHAIKVQSTASEMMIRARDDSFLRFSKAINFPAILNQIQSTSK